jgi:hypothetical protein
MEEVDAAIISKFTEIIGGNHNSLHVAIGGRMFNEGAPIGTQSPFISFHEVSDIYEPTFEEDLENILIQFNIYSNTIPELNTLFGYLKNLYDKCSLTVSGYNYIYMRREQSYKMRVDNYFALISEYRIMIRKN